MATKAIQKKENHVSFSMKINSTAYQNAIQNTLQDPQRCMRFTSALTSAVANQPELQECDASTTLSAALLGESLNLSPSPQLGQYYLVPFNDRKRGRKVATFVLGYKGMIQLAIRSGQYKDLGAAAIKEGELVSYNPITEHAELDPIMDPEDRAKAKTAGYYAWFETVNGFKKTIYWTREQMEAHAEKYSAGYRAHKGYTFWEKDFDGMAKKTMLRQLISKWGIMSIEMQTAYTNDMATVNHDEKANIFAPETYPDNDKAVGPDAVEIEPETEPQADTEPQQVNLNDL